MATTAFNLGGGKLKLTKTYSFSETREYVSSSPRITTTVKCRLLVCVFSTPSVHSDNKYRINCNAGGVVVSTQQLKYRVCHYAIFSDVPAGAVVDFGYIANGVCECRAYALN
nr:MAG TPA: hypothetical protein [Caudoviricetes sp.]